MMPPFKKLNTESQDLNRVQDAVANALSRLASSPMADASIIGPVHLVAGSPNIVKTLLARQAQGYVIIGRDADAAIWNGIISSNLVLYTDVDVTVSILVF